MEFPIIVISILIMFIAVGSVGFLLGRYIERLDWNKLIWEGKIPKPKKTKKFGTPIIASNFYKVEENA